MKTLSIPLAALAAVATPADAAELLSGDGPVVELTVTEAVEAQPDTVTIGAGVTAEANTAVNAMRQNADAMTRVIERIKALGIPERDIRTTGISLGAQYDYDETTRRQRFRGYQASNRVSLRLSDIQRTGPVLDALVASGATDLSGPDWSVADDAAARSQARKAAMAEAQRQALEYAQLAGYSGVRLLAISENTPPRGPMPMMRMQAVAAQSTPVQPGMVEAAVTVTVRFALTR